MPKVNVHVLFSMTLFDIGIIGHPSSIIQQIRKLYVNLSFHVDCKLWISK